MVERAVSPSDCVLLVAIPLTWEAFRADAENPQKDYVRHILAGSTDLAGVWSLVYEPNVVAHATRVGSQLSTHGAHYVPHATLPVLAEAFVRYSVVALITHSRLLEIAPADVLRPDRFISKIRTPTSSLATGLAGHLPQLATLNPADANAPHDIAESLNAVIRPTYEYFRAGPGRWANGHNLALPLTRLLVEAEFPGTFAPSRSIELHDGLATVEEIARIIPPAFPGILDLSVCNSALVGDVVKRAVPFPGLVVANAFPADPQVRLVRFGLIMKVLSLKRSRYSDAATQAHRFMMKG